MSWRSTSMQVVGSTATAVVWWGSCFEHGGEAEEVAVAGLGEDDFLAVLVEEGDVDCAFEHDVGGAAGVAGFVDALLGGEVAELDLGGEDGRVRRRRGE